MTLIRYLRRNIAHRSLTLTVFFTVALFMSAEAIGAEEAAVAKIVDCHMPISIHGTKTSSAAIGTELHKSDTVVVAQNGSATIMFADGSIQKFVGPTVITMASKNKSSQGLLGKLASGLVEMFFPSGREIERVRLAVRGSITSETPSLTIPLLIYPPRGGILMAPPDHLAWLPIDNATLYTVFLYDQNHLIWQERTQNAVVNLPTDSLELKAGESYFWIIQADIGNASLRSEQSVFGMIDTLSRIQVDKTLKEINSSGFNSRLASLLRINLYESRNLLVEEYQEVDDLLKKSPNDYMALLAKAQLSEAMNMYREAAAYYRQALAQ